MKITKSWLKEKSACLEGTEWFLAQKETDGIRVLKALIKDHKLGWANWLIVRVMGKTNCARHAIFAAEQALSILKKKCPNDDRPRKAIEAAKAWIENPKDEKKRAVACPAYASAASDAAFAYAYASAASDAASADAYASAASDAAFAYAYASAASAASDAAFAYAYASAASAASADAFAYASAAREKLKIKILEYGIKLIKESN
jgi:hypothetical protein